MSINLSSLPTDPEERLRTLESEIRKELDQTREQLSEIQLLLQQSNSEADKLAQREGAVTTRVRDMEINLENYTRNDIKTLYTTGQEIALRLFMMRSQVEQLQMRNQHVKERQEMLNSMIKLVLMAGQGSLAAATPTATSRPMVDATAATAGIGRIIQAQESERQHVSRYLHDGPAQTLTNLVLKAEICEHMIERDTAEARAELQSLRGSLTTTLQDMRRLIFDLRPMILDDIGVVPTLRRYLAEIGRSRGFTPTVRGPESEEAISAPARALIFRLVQDVVAGLASRATLEQVVVDLSASGAEIELTIDVRASGETPPSFDEVINQEQVAQRLFMLSASTEVAQVGDRGAQLVINATTPAA